MAQPKVTKKGKEKANTPSGIIGKVHLPIY
jgi:hypothetical protein